LACLFAFFPSISSPASFLASSHLPCAWRDHTILVCFFPYHALCRLLFFFSNVIVSDFVSSGFS
jgi:hypothetical protein